MRITPEAYLAAMFRFLGDRLLNESEKIDTAVCILDELEEVAGIRFSPEEREELTDQITDILNEKTTIQDVEKFINLDFGKSKIPSVAVFFLSHKDIKPSTSSNCSDSTGGGKK